MILVDLEKIEKRRDEVLNELIAESNKATQHLMRAKELRKQYEEIENALELINLVNEG